MNVVLRISLLAGLFIYYGCIFHLLKRKNLSLKYTLLWLISGVVMLFFVIFPNVLERIIHLFGVVELTNGLFAILLFLGLIILISVSSAISQMNDQIRKLIQRCALYEKRIRKLEEKLDEKDI
ncbi:MAG: DUF2304 domain-containing protein [Eubacterium sp.]|nr:DUF2304 domain-containing protein [Eubacterium sp.]MDD7210449.1 DUF2304 domain-containing protein [Lachnospiraceae bacterium]